LATLRFSTSRLCGHCISCQLMGTICTPARRGRGPSCRPQNRLIAIPCKPQNHPTTRRWICPAPCPLCRMECPASAAHAILSRPSRSAVPRIRQATVWSMEVPVVNECDVRIASADQGGRCMLTSEPHVSHSWTLKGPRFILALHAPALHDRALSSAHPRRSGRTQRAHPGTRSGRKPSACRAACDARAARAAPSTLFAYTTPSSLRAVARKYERASPSEATSARTRSPGRKQAASSTLSTSVARTSCCLPRRRARRSPRRRARAALQLKRRAAANTGDARQPAARTPCEPGPPAEWRLGAARRPCTAVW